jgi:YCII-related domain
MTDLPDDIQLAFAELPRERAPDPALEERVMRAVYAPQRRRWWFAGTVLAAAAVLVLMVAHPWSRPGAAAGKTYVLILSNTPQYLYPPAGKMPLREHEYGLWADSLAKLGKLDLEGKVLGQGEISGLFIIRAADDAEAERIAQTCPHVRYRGHIEVRQFVE